MAKRSRVGSRPGQRRPLQRPTAKPASARPANTVTDEEMARAAELEAQILAEEQAAEEARRGRSRRAKEVAVADAIYTSTPLAERAAIEYAYVRRDLRRLTIVCASLLLVLGLIYVLLNVLNLV